MNILISINDTYLLACETMLISFFRNNPGKHSIFLFYHHLSKKSLCRLDKIANKYLSSLHPILIDESCFEGKPLLGHFTIEVYDRILIYKLLPKSVNRILWIDSDIIVNKPIDDLYDINLSGYLIAACKNTSGNDNATRIGIGDNDNYFNSGLILFDVERIREVVTDKDVENCFKVLGSKILNPDQDVLNLLYFKKTKLLDPFVYNNQLYPDKKHSKKEIVKKAKIIHYVTAWKPWKIKCSPLLDTTFFKYLIFRHFPFSMFLFVSHRLYGFFIFCKKHLRKLLVALHLWRP